MGVVRGIYGDRTAVHHRQHPAKLLRSLRGGRELRGDVARNGVLAISIDHDRVAIVVRSWPSGRRNCPDHSQSVRRLDLVFSPMQRDISQPSWWSPVAMPRLLQSPVSGHDQQRPPPTADRRLPEPRGRSCGSASAVAHSSGRSWFPN